MANNLNTAPLGSQSLTNTKFDGYRSIWFELNQKYEFGDKYSGALGTYTAKHIPLAIYAPEVDKTFFVYGGTTAADKRYLLCMIGEYDHKTGMVSKPTVVHDKKGVNDPHDNPSLLLDDDGYIFVFVSGRGRKRPGFIYKSKTTFNIDKFEKISEQEITYPQPWNTKWGFLHFFTKYTGIRQLYFKTSLDGKSWSKDKLLADIPVKKGEKSGHYQVSNCYKKEKVGTFFNRHPNGNVDRRTDLYYVQTVDFGKTWTNVKGGGIDLPIIDMDSSTLAVNYRSKKKNVYLKDIGFDEKGNPVCLYMSSKGALPGPENEPYEWCITRWDGAQWNTSVITKSDHNYDMGSLYIIGENDWRVVGPTEIGPQKWGVGGEIAIWKSEDKGKSWEKLKQITEKSKYNHSYVRRPVNYKSPFCYFWSDGHSHEISKCRLYFGDFKGNIWQLPYEMKKDYERPITL